MERPRVNPTLQQFTAEIELARAAALPETRGMNRTETRQCLRTIQVITTVAGISEDQIQELVQAGLIVRDGKQGVRLTTRGVLVKTGEI